VKALLERVWGDSRKAWLRAGGTNCSGEEVHGQRPAGLGNRLCVENWEGRDTLCCVIHV
jgi:hypothetical protein